MTTGIRILKEFYNAINRNDTQAITEHFDARIVRIEFPGSPAAGTYRGIADVSEKIAKGRGTWAEGTCEPEKFLAKADKVVAFLHVRVRLKDSTDWIDARFADGFEFRNGKITQYHSFEERTDALKWAGIEVPRTK